jgi:UDP-glucuronate 4-epimerase
MTVLVTGAAGFIGCAVSLLLLARGDDVLGIDDLNAYYDPSLKQARLARLEAHENFTFYQGDIAEPEMFATAAAGRRISRVVHLAAQAGVRHSLKDPRAYVRSNVAGHLEMLEFCRHAGTIEHLVYASSSSVYGGNTKVPFSEDDRVDRPASLYAATKRADELMSHSYAHLYGIAQTGLRYFTVYGPWGRPDMAYWMFTKAILEGSPIKVFNHGDMQRDFTYIDDIVEGTLNVLDSTIDGIEPPHRVYNIGNSRPEQLETFIELLETLLGRKAVRQYEPMAPGDVTCTYADTSRLRHDFGYVPTVPLADGLKEFTTWYREFHGIG